MAKPRLYPVRDRKIAVMVLEGHKYREVSEVFDLSIHHIRTLVFRDCLRAMGLQYIERKAPPITLKELRKDHAYLIPHFLEEIEQMEAAEQ